MKTTLPPVVSEGAPALPGMHTDSYFPEPDRAIRAGVRTMSAAVIDLLPVK